MNLTKSDRQIIHKQESRRIYSDKHNNKVQ